MKKTNRVTLWSVDYTGAGYYHVYTRFFESYDEAKIFANQDYHDNPVKRTYTAENAKRIMDNQAMDDAYNSCY